MARSKTRDSACLSGSNPYGAGSAYEGQRIVADELRWTVQRELDRIICIGANGTEFVGDAYDYSRGVGAVADQFAIVGHQGELSIDSIPR
jgi:hypothetical protein